MHTKMRDLASEFAKWRVAHVNSAPAQRDATAEVGAVTADSNPPTQALLQAGEHLRVLGRGHQHKTRRTRRRHPLPQRTGWARSQNPKKVDPPLQSLVHTSQITHKVFLFPRPQASVRSVHPLSAQIAKVSEYKAEKGCNTQRHTVIRNRIRCIDYSFDS